MILEKTLYYKQISKVTNEVDRQPSSLLTCMQVSVNNASFTPMHLVFLELDTHDCQLDLKLLHENNSAVIPNTFYLKLLNKDNEYLRHRKK